ncbi:MAG: hypothetical protein JO015_15225 [Verrucomicrobia bacterium]|nr:hypothetical protein [Verrucomicrobiota bacterium]
MLCSGVLRAALTAWVLKSLVACAAAQGVAGPFHPPEAAWSPPPELSGVRVRWDCAHTRHGIGVAIQPNFVYPRGAIFLCPERARAIEAANPSASRFFLVHEYGHLALCTRDEGAADRWAATQLKGTRGGRQVLSAAVAHFLRRPEMFDPLYGSNLDRALRVAESGDLPLRDWPARLILYRRRCELAAAERPVARVQLAPGYINRAEMILVVDGHAVGYLSTQPPSTGLLCPPLSAGPHEIKAVDVWIYHDEPGERSVMVARSLAADCKLEGHAGKTVLLSLAYDEDLDLRAELR